MGIMNRIQTMVAGGLLKNMGPSEGTVGQIGVATAANTSAFTVTVAQIALGALRITSLAANANVTTPTATQINDAALDMGIGDSFHFWVRNVANIATWVAGTGITIAGQTTLPAASFSLVVVTKTGASAYTWTTV